MALATYKVLVDWNNDGDFADSNDDVSGNVLSLEFMRGSELSAHPTGRPIAGALRMELNNTSGIYSSFLSSGALYGSLLPSRKVQVQAGNSGFDYTFPFTFLHTPIWTGYIKLIKPVVSVGKAPKAVISAIGALGKLNQARANVPQALNQRTDQLIDDVLDAAGWAADDRNLDEGQTTITRYWSSGGQTLATLNDIAETEVGWIKETVDGKIAFENRHHRYNQTHANTTQGTFSDASGSALTYTAIEQRDSLPQVFNSFRAGAKVYTVGSLAVLWTLPDIGASSPSLDVGQVTNAVSVNAWTTTDATTDMVANSASDGSGDNLTSSVGISVTKTGERMKIQLTNNAGVFLYITKLQARGTPITESNVGRVLVQDSDSITAYGEREYPKSAKWLPNADESTNYCLYNINLFKDVTPRIIITITGKNDAHMGHMLSRDLHDRITVTATNATRTNLGINGDFQIDKISHSIKPMFHSVKWELTPITGSYGSYWSVGFGVLDSSTRLGY